MPMETNGPTIIKGKWTCGSLGEKVPLTTYWYLSPEYGELVEKILKRLRSLFSNCEIRWISFSLKGEDTHSDLEKLFLRISTALNALREDGILYILLGEIGSVATTKCCMEEILKKFSEKVQSGSLKVVAIPTDDVLVGKKLFNLLKKEEE